MDLERVMRNADPQAASPMRRRSHVFTRLTWTAVGVLLASTVLALGAWLPRPVAPATMAAALAIAALVVLGLGMLPAVRVRRRVEHSPAAPPAEATPLERKLEYLASLSHEIRTPITSILGYTDVLCTEDLPAEEQLEHLETIRRNGDHLLSVVRDVLDLSRLEAGTVEPIRVETDVSTLVLDVADMMRAEARDRGLVITVRARGPVPESIDTDPTCVRQILINLLSNAVKFSEEGGIDVVVGLDGDDRALLIDVVDHGPGLSESERAVVFEPWMQGEAAALVPGGSGLGLAVARGLATALGGTLGVRSGPGAGSVFTLALPLGAQPTALLDADVALGRLPAAGRAEAETMGLDGRVLLVEDAADARRLFTRFLRQAGCDVTAAIDAPDAVAAVAAATGRPFDVVVLDLDLAVVSGCETVRRLRAAGVTAPVVGLTAYAGADRTTAARAAGCTEVLPKPATRSELLTVLARHLAVVVREAAADDPPVDTASLGALPQGETLVRIFVSVLERRVAEMEEAFAAGEAERLRRLAERTKSAAGGYGLVAIADAAAMLEVAAAQGRDVRACLDRLCATCRQVQAGRRSSNHGTA